MTRLSKTGSTHSSAVIAFALGAGLLLVAADAAPGSLPAQRAALASPQPATTPPVTTPSATATPASAPPAVDNTPRYENSIVAVVNDEPVSSYELHQRMALVMSTSNMPDTPEIRKKIREKVLEQLETEKLQIQEARRNNITVSSVEVDKEIQGILTNNNMTMDQLKAVLAHGNVAMATLRGQIAAQILWQKTVQQEYQGRINISPEAVDAEMARIAESANKPHYVVSEIFLAVDSPEQDEKVHKDIVALAAQIEAGAPFAAVAKQFSQSPSAAQGGEMGVVYEGQLAPELNQALAKMKTGDMSEPIRSIGGYYILLLRQRLEPAGTKVPVAAEPSAAELPSTLPLARVLLPLGSKPGKELAENALKVAAAIRSNITNCQTLPKIVQKIQGAVFMDLGTTRLADLSGQIRDVLAKTAAGETTPPFLSSAGVELLVRCDKAVPKMQAFVLPTREQVEQQLFEEQISALARRYNRDLKRNADIEVR